MVRRRKPQRGVLLLIVLSLLVLFVLIGVTFIVVAGQYTKSAKAYSQHELKGDTPSKELDGALMQLLRGTDDPNQMMWRHNVLRDLYGQDGFEGVVVSSSVDGAKVQGQQFLAVVFRDLAGNARASNHYYAGSVFTLLDGQGEGQSTRILRYQAPTLVNGVRQGSFILEAFDDMSPGFVPVATTRFAVNGKPFNGTGDGFDPQTGKLDAKTIFPPPDPLQFETALLPFATPKRSPGNGALLDYGDGDESWDAADYQNLFLARIPSQMPLTGVALNSDPLIPSFHRPYLINYWMHRLPDEGRDWRDTPAVRRSVVARPMPENHPFFTGGNPKMIGSALSVINDADGDGIMDHPLIRGPWDVDNDNDGVADSIWVDLGSPIKATPDGRLYKPLYAILCVDMDGRLNVNAHGTREILAMSPNGLGDFVDPVAAGPLATVTTGQGYGPAEIRLDSAFQSWFSANGVPRYTRLLSERYRLRNGEFENPPAPGLIDGKPFPNNTSFLNSIQLWGLPSNFLMPAPGEGNLYATPPDLAGVGAVYLDYSGQPRFVLNQQGFPAMGVPHPLNLPFPFSSPLTNAVQDNPYEIDLLSQRAEDSIFGEDQLEELLRHNDMDMQMLRDANPAFPPFELPTTLSRIVATPIDPPNQAQIFATLSHQLTTRSFDIPALNAGVADAAERKDVATQVITSGSSIKSTDVAAVSVVELAIKRLLKSKSDRTDVDAQLRVLLPPEVRDGRRMDLNRLFGNGIDDNGNGLVDEPIEWAVDQKIWAGTGFEATGQFGDNPFYSRQEFARHLFCLAMLAVDEGFRIPMHDPAGQPVTPASRQATARRLAQWAINVVDFRDPDSVMTPFEYDWDPFDEDGWSVDDRFTTDKQVEVDRQIVWGSESPELLITETLAFHDRRVRDTDMELQDEAEDGDQDQGIVERRFPQENNNDNPVDNIQQVDESLDQYRIPQGSLFIELYATGNPARNNLPPRRDLYNVDGTLDLGRVATDAKGRSPVWRIAIARVPPDPGLNTEPADLELSSGGNVWKNGEQAVLLPALLDERTLDITINAQPDNFRTVVNSDALVGAGTATGVPENQVQYDRFIIFSRDDPGLTIPRTATYYYNHNGNASAIVGDPFAPLVSLTPGEYAVIGPRPVTVVGSRRASAANPTDPSEPSYQRLVLRPYNSTTGEGGLYYYDFNITNQSGPGIRPADIKAARPIIVAADPPSTWNPANQARYPLGIGVNVSEPTPALTYYREPKVDFPPTAPRLDPLNRLRYEEPPSYYSDLAISEKSLPDVPLDNPAAGQAYPLADFNGKFLMTGTHRKFRVALLQRLADPTRSWDATTNPYLTVDSQSIDLTVFNGEEDSSTPPTGWDDAQENPATGTPYDLYDDDQSGLNPDELFESRERGSRIANSPYMTQPGTTNGPNVWNPISRVPNPTQITDNNAERAYWGYGLGQTLGYLNSTYGFRRPGPPEVLGAPTQPIPWLTWNNRPYVSQFELLLVPSSAPWRLPFEMRRVPTMPPDTSDRHDDFIAPWAHLLNFFYEDPTSGANNPNLAVLLDWLEVPSRFTGTQKWLNPQVAYDKLPQVAEYGPPLNKISRFRDPGKINVNTIPDMLVWQAIDPQQTTQWVDIQQSLAGTESVQNRPAFYANPARAATSGDLMPLHDLETSPVDATLLRRDRTSDGKLLFDFPMGNNANDSQLHPYFQYQKLQRLANLLTTHSNVYAVWITVGHFEVYPWNASNPQLAQISMTDPSLVTPFPDAAHPDGYQLGPELDSDRGLVKRHRAFYIIDRSIPVGFKPGQDLNIDRMILLRRMIE